MSDQLDEPPSVSRWLHPWLTWQRVRFQVRQHWHRWQYPSQEERNLRQLLLTSIGVGILVGIVTTFLSVFAVRLGASRAQVSWITSGPALLSVFWTLPAARIVERQTRLVYFFTRITLITWGGYLVVALIPFLPAAWRVPGLIALVVLMAMPGALSNLTFMSLLAELVPGTTMASLVSMRYLLMGVTSSASVYLGGQLLDHIAFPLNYQVMFGIAFLASVEALYHFSRLDMPQVQEEENPPPVEVPLVVGESVLLSTSKSRWEAAVARVAHHLDRVRIRVARRRDQVQCYVGMITAERRFLYFVLVALVFHWGLYMPIPLFPVFWVRELGASDGWIGTIATARSILSAGSYFVWGKVATRYGNVPTLAVSIMGLSLFPLLTGMARSPEFLIVPAIVGGFFAPGMNVTLLTSLLETCPTRHRPTFVGVFQVLANLAVFLAPLAGAALSEHTSLRIVFVVGTAVRLASGLLFAKLARHKE
ncbi:MAG TPA: MFS transporter [Anaerolineae bacterium]|nr:MFS transporter [Anaerolineae bacterium]